MRDGFPLRKGQWKGKMLTAAEAVAGTGATEINPLATRKARPLHSRGDVPLGEMALLHAFHIPRPEQRAIILQTYLN
jgi:hypothetical protein